MNAVPGRIMNAEDRPMPSLERAESLGAQAYRAVREHIAMAPRPGEAVNERTLALRLGVSPTPVREALAPAGGRGLIARQDRRKSTVVSHSPETLRQLIYVEVTLRAAQARFATPNMTEEILGQLDAIVDEIEHIDRAPARKKPWIRRPSSTSSSPAPPPTHGEPNDRERVDLPQGDQGPFHPADVGEPRAAHQDDPVREHREIIAAFRRADPELVDRRCVTTCSASWTTCSTKATKAKEHDGDIRPRVGDLPGRHARGGFPRLPSSAGLTWARMRSRGRRINRFRPPLSGTGTAKAPAPRFAGIWRSC